MKLAYETKDIRNICFASHGGAGKTTLTESFAFNSKLIDRMGKVPDGNTLSDFEPEEIKRQISLNLSVVPIDWKNLKINTIDTPGYFDFVGEVRAGLRVADTAVVVVDVTSGIQTGTEKMMTYCEDIEKPCAIIINKMDRDNVDFHEVYSSIRQTFGNKCTALFLPLIDNRVFSGLIDILNKKIITEQGEKDLSAEQSKEVDELYAEIVEAAVEADDEMMEKYLSGETISNEELKSCLTKAIALRSLIPVIPVSAFANIGIKALMDFITQFFPSPLDMTPSEVTVAEKGDKIKLPADSKGPLAALVFKTLTDPYVGKITLFKVMSGTLSNDVKLYNVDEEKEEKMGQLSFPVAKKQENASAICAGDIGALTKLMFTKTGHSLSGTDQKFKIPWVPLPNSNAAMALYASNKADEDKLGAVIPKIQEDDPTIKIVRDEETKQTVIYGVGETHLNVVAEKIKRKFSVSIDLKPPRISYKETIRKAVKVEGKHKKQSGGHGQFGHCWLEISPLPRGEKFLFESKIFGGAIPKNYIPAIEKGVHEAMIEGILAGYPVEDVRVVVYDGSYHPVDSSEIAFKIAASMAFKKAMQEGETVLLEPIMNVTIHVPEQYMGSVIDDLNTKRGRVLGVEADRNWQTINAQMPLNELTRYTTDIGSITAAKGYFELAFSHYEEAPPKVVKTVVEEAKLEKEKQEG
jgi:elongation factor G